MVSINSSSTLAIRNLQAISKALEETQNRMTTGFKVSSAKDNASAWAAATSIRSEMKTYDTLSNGLDSLSTATDVATTGVDAVVSALTRMKDKVIAYGAESDSDKKAIILADIASIKKELVTTYGAAEVNGSNWLDGSQATVSYSASVDAAGVPVTETFTTTDLKTALSTTVVHATNLNKTLTADWVAGDLNTAGIGAAKTYIDTVLTSAKLYSSQLSALSSRTGAQQVLLQKLSDVKEGALSKLVDADLEEEAAKASALQVKQQLAYQVLSMTNASASNILRLFQ